MKRFIKVMLLMLGLSTVHSWLYAGILASSTRVIYAEKDRENSLMLANTNAYPIFTQIWIDDGSNDPDFKDPPFVVLPAVFQMSPKEIKGVRILYNGLPLAQDRESVYWLNLYEIPGIQKDALGHDYLNLAMNTQLKVFFRPKSLTGLPIDDINAGLQFSIFDTVNEPQQIKIKNSTAYHVTIINLSLIDKTSATALYDQANLMLAPFQQQLISTGMPSLNISDRYKVKYALIDDQGVSHFFEKAIEISK